MQISGSESDFEIWDDYTFENLKKKKKILILMQYCKWYYIHCD